MRLLIVYMVSQIKSNPDMEDVGEGSCIYNFRSMTYFLTLFYLLIAEMRMIEATCLYTATSLPFHKIGNTRAANNRPDAESRVILSDGEI